MILILLGYLLFSLFGNLPIHAAIEDFQEQVAKVVHDPDRASRIEKELDSLKAAIETSEAAFLLKEEAFLVALRKHDTNPTTLRTLLEAIASERTRLQTRMVASRSVLRAAMTPAEWTRSFPIPEQR